MQRIFTEKKRIDELKVSSGHSNLFHEHISAEDGGPGENNSTVCLLDVS